jgi:hypothetical protein
VRLLDGRVKRAVNNHLSDLPLGWMIDEAFNLMFMCPGEKYKKLGKVDERLGLVKVRLGPDRGDSAKRLQRSRGSSCRKDQLT